MVDVNKAKFRLQEIAAATGMEAKTLNARKTVLLRNGEIEPRKGKLSEYTYEEVKKLLRRPLKPGEPRGEFVTALRRQLQNDGYPIKKGGE